MHGHQLVCALHLPQEVVAGCFCGLLFLCVLSTLHRSPAGAHNTLLTGWRHHTPCCPSFATDVFGHHSLGILPVCATNFQSASNSMRADCSVEQTPGENAHGAGCDCTPHCCCHPMHALPVAISLVQHDTCTRPKNCKLCMWGCGGMNCQSNMHHTRPAHSTMQEQARHDTAQASGLVVHLSVRAARISNLWLLMPALTAYHCSHAAQAVHPMAAQQQGRTSIAQGDAGLTSLLHRQHLRLLLQTPHPMQSHAVQRECQMCSTRGTKAGAHRTS